MSARNGDKSRFGRQRKQKIARRLEMRKLQPAKPASVESTESGDKASKE